MYCKPRASGMDMHDQQYSHSRATAFTSELRQTRSDLGRHTFDLTFLVPFLLSHIILIINNFFPYAGVQSPCLSWTTSKSNFA